MARPKRRRPEFLGDFLPGHLRELGWDRRIAEEEVLARWVEAVGPSIAAHARPSHFNGRRLTVVTESPVWTQQLSLLRPDLLRRIARRFGADLATELYFVTGRIDPPAPAAPAAPAELPPAPYEGELPADIAGGIAAIGDAGLRAAVERSVRASLGRRRG
jgi:hypothetical protein